MRILKIYLLALGLGLIGGVAQEIRRPDPQTDTRLNQMLSLRYAAMPLKDLLADLSKRTGVSLTVETRVREYRAFARLQNKPLHEVMRLLAKAFGFEWRAETDPQKPDAPPRYVLYQPAADRLAEQRWQKLYQTDMIALMRDIVRSIPPELLQRDHAEFAKAIGAAPEVVFNMKGPEPPFRPLMQSFIPNETDPYRALLHHARQSLLSYAGQYHNAWLALQMMARFSERDWQTLHEQSVLAVAVDAIPNDLRTQWAEAEQKTQERKRETAEMATEEGAEITIEPESDQPGSETDDEQIRGIIQGLESKSFPPLTSVIFTYDPTTQSLMAELCSQQVEANETINRFRLGFGFELRAWLFEAYHSFGVDLQELTRLADTPQPYNPWELRKPFAEIRDAAWRRAKQSDWANWLSYRWIEACEGADIETIGEFCPLYTYMPLDDTSSPARTWGALMALMIRGHRMDFDGKVTVWQSGLRPLARLMDAPPSRLRPLLSLEQPTLETLAALTVALPYEAFPNLTIYRTEFLNEFAPNEAAHTDAWLSALEQLEYNNLLYWALRLYHSLTPPQRNALRRPRGLSWNDLSQSQKAIALRLLFVMERGSFDCSLVDAYRTQAPTLQLRLTEARGAPMRKTVRKPDEKGVWRTQVYRYQQQEYKFSLRVGRQDSEVAIVLPEPLPDPTEAKQRQKK